MESQGRVRTCPQRNLSKTKQHFIARKQHRTYSEFRAPRSSIGFKGALPKFAIIIKMNRLSHSFVILVFLIGLVSCATAPNTITTNGIGKLSRTPDIAKFTVGSTARATTLADAITIAADKTKAISAVLARHDLSNVQAEEFKIEADLDKNGKEVGKKVRWALRVTLMNLTSGFDASWLTSDLTSINNIEISELDYSFSNKLELEKEGQTAAIADAKDKATQSAELINRSLGSMVSATTTKISYNKKQVFANPGGKFWTAVPRVMSVMLGETEIEVEVEVVWSVL